MKTIALRFSDNYDPPSGTIAEHLQGILGYRKYIGQDGEIMAEWKELTVGDLCDTISDTYHRNNDEVVLVNTSDVLEGRILNHQAVENKNLKGQFKKTFKKDDILYSEIRPANKRYAYVDFEETDRYIASTKLMVLRPKTELVNPRFFFVFLFLNHV